MTMTFDILTTDDTDGTDVRSIGGFFLTACRGASRSMPGLARQNLREGSRTDVAQVCNLCGQRNSDSAGSMHGVKRRDGFPPRRTGRKPVHRRRAGFANGIDTVVPSMFVYRPLLHPRNPCNPWSISSSFQE